MTIDPINRARLLAYSIEESVQTLNIFVHLTHRFNCPHKAKEKSIDPHALAIAVHRNIAWPITDKNGKPLYGKDGKPATENRLEVDQFTPHDLRRTVATFMAEMGEMDEVIYAILNHSKQGVIKVYNQYRYDKEKQAALESWERRLQSILTDTKNSKKA